MLRSYKILPSACFSSLPHVPRQLYSLLNLHLEPILSRCLTYISSCVCPLTVPQIPNFKMYKTTTGFNITVTAGVFGWLIYGWFQSFHTEDLSFILDKKNYPPFNPTHQITFLKFFAPPAFPTSVTGTVPFYLLGHVAKALAPPSSSSYGAPYYD